MAARVVVSESVAIPSEYYRENVANRLLPPAPEPCAVNFDLGITIRQPLAALSLEISQATQFTVTICDRDSGRTRPHYSRMKRLGELPAVLTR